MEKKIITHIIVSSDRAAQGTYEDKAGPAAREWLEKNGYNNTGITLIPDDLQTLQEKIETILAKADLIIVSGGTGLGPKDITPQAIKAIADYEIPGFGELLRKESLKYSLNAYLSRCGGYVKNHKLILALPGNPKAVTEQLEILSDLLVNAICALKGECKHRRRTGASSPSMRED